VAMKITNMLDLAIRALSGDEEKNAVGVGIYELSAATKKMKLLDLAYMRFHRALPCLTTGAKIMTRCEISQVSISLHPFTPYPTNI